MILFGSFPKGLESRDDETEYLHRHDGHQESKIQIGFCTGFGFNLMPSIYSEDYTADCNAYSCNG